MDATQLESPHASAIHHRGQAVDFLRHGAGKSMAKSGFWYASSDGISNIRVSPSERAKMDRRHAELERRKRQAKQRAGRTKNEQSAQSNRSSTDLHIGYFAHHQGRSVCEGDACLITGSVEAMERFIRANGFSGFVIQATTFSEIMRGINLGAAYCFDEQAYGRFLEPGRAAGLRLTQQDFSDPGPTGTHLLIVRHSPI